MSDIATPARALAAELVAFTDVTSLADAVAHARPGRSAEAARVIAAHTDAASALVTAAAILADARAELADAVADYTALPLFAR